MPAKILTITPRTAAEAAEAFRSFGASAASGLSVRVMVVESPFRPSDGDIACDELVLASHAAMNEIHEVSKNDFLAVVGGGAKFGDVVTAAREAGLYFPHEPGPRTRETTIAGLIMGGARFRTERRYGRLREYVLSLEIAMPGGEVVRTGSRSVKDVTGYDITGLVIGGGGRCGMVARATIRLLPAPGTRLGFTCEGAPEALESLAGEIRRTLVPAFVEFAGQAGGTAPARLIGELQSAVRGREEALLGSISGLAPEGVRVSMLDLAALAEMGTGGGTLPSARSAGENARVLDELESRLYRVFDPHGIMLP
jgi:FAD/FMN-containing dehydrogenase